MSRTVDSTPTPVLPPSTMSGIRPVEIRQHMHGFRRARLAAAIRARCSKRTVKRAQKLKRDRMIGHPDANRVEARRDIFRNDTGSSYGR